MLSELYSHQIQLLKELVEIPSDSFDPQGVNRVQDKLKNELESLNFQVEKKCLQNTQHGDLLKAVKKGAGSLVVTLVMHADTVFPEELGFLGFRHEGETGYGPGVIDDKGGIVVALGALRLLSEKQHVPTLQVICSPSEEVGSPGWHDLFDQVSQSSDYIFGFEPAMNEGHIIISRKGGAWFRLFCQTQGGHAGRDHATRVNAYNEMHYKLGPILSLTNYDQGLTVNVGSLKAGEGKYNVICQEVEACLDTRFAREIDYSIITNTLDSVVNQQFLSPFEGEDLVKSGYEILTHCPPWENKTSSDLIDSYLTHLRKIEGRPFESLESSGSSDCNYLTQHCEQIIDGLGPIGGKLHTQQEYVVLPSLVTRARAFADFVESIMSNASV